MTDNFKVIVSMTIVDDNGNLVTQKVMTLGARPTLLFPTDDATDTMKEEAANTFSGLLRGTISSFNGKMYY